MPLGYDQITSIEGNTPGGTLVATLPRGLATRAVAFRLLVAGALAAFTASQIYVEMRIGQTSISRVRLDRLQQLQDIRQPAGRSSVVDDAAALVGKSLTFPLRNYGPELTAAQTGSTFVWYFGQDVRSDATDFQFWLGQADLKPDEQVKFYVTVPNTANASIQVFHQSVPDPKNQKPVGAILAYRENAFQLSSTGPVDFPNLLDQQNYLAILWDGLNDNDGLVIKAGSNFIINEPNGIVSPGLIGAAFNAGWANLSVSLIQNPSRITPFDPDERLSSAWPAQAVAPVVTVNSGSSTARTVTAVTQLVVGKDGRPVNLAA